MMTNGPSARIGEVLEVPLARPRKRLELARALAGRGPRECGDALLLRRYERARAEPVLAMRTAVNGLFSLFSARIDAAARVRNAGLNFTDRLPILKNVLARYAAS